jgi:hypothetical protein
MNAQETEQAFDSKSPGNIVRLREALKKRDRVK